MLMIILSAAASCASAQTQSQMTQCAVSAYASADTAMARQWKTTHVFMKARDAQDRSRGGGFGYAAGLLASQRAWLKYRDTQCVIAAGAFTGGSMQPMASAQSRHG